MAVIKPIFNQTNYDVVNKLYGNMDLLVKMAIDNNISDLNVMADIYTYDPTDSRINASFIGFNYATNFNPDANICMVPTGLSFSDISNFSFTFHWDNSAGLNYQYVINTGATPTTEWIDTTASAITVMGVTDNTDWFVWLRTKCSDCVYSTVIHAKIHTPAFVCNLVTGFYVDDITDMSVDGFWDLAGSYDTFQYGITTDSGTPPSSPSETTSASAGIGGLDSDTDYWFFIRRKCDDTHFSSWIYQWFHTLVTPPPTPTPPVMIDLVFASFGDVGVSQSGSLVSSWQDIITGYGTTLSASATAQVVNTHFGGKNAIYFPSGGATFAMSAPFTLISGANGCTIFLVASSPHISSGGPVFVGVDTAFGSTPGLGGFFIQQNPSDQIFHQTHDSSGGSSINTGDNAFITGSDFLETLKIDLTASPSAKKTLLYYNNDPTGYNPGTSNIVATSGMMLGTQLRVGFTQDQIIACVLIYKRALSNTEITATWSYLQSYYSL